MLGEGNARWLLLPDRTYRGVSAAEKRGEAVPPAGARPYKPGDLQSQGAAGKDQLFEFQGRNYRPGSASHWKANFPTGMTRLAAADRIHVAANSIQYRRFADDYPFTQVGNIWTDTLTGSFTETKRYVVQTNTKVIERCLHLTTDPGDLVLDPTCGSGTTAWCAEKWGRRWITIDTSRVTVTLARERVLTALFESYATRDGGVDPSAGLAYRTAAHITLGDIARNVHLDPIVEEHREVVAERLEACNQALAKVPRPVKAALKAKLDQKEKEHGKSAVTEGDRRRWLLPPENRDRSKARREGATVDLDAAHWYEWEVPFDPDPDWPEDLAETVGAFRAAWQRMMAAIDESVAANSPQEELVDQPEVVPGVLRVSGPFTVEGVRPEELSLRGPHLMADDEPGHAVGTDDAKNLGNYLTRMVQLLRNDGVTFPNNQHRKFARLEALFETTGGAGTVVHAEGVWEGTDGSDEDSVAVTFGPQFGPVTAEQVEDFIRAARRYDELVVAGFSFDSEAQAVLQETSHPKVQIHQAYVRPDVNPGMDGLLKETQNNQLFSVFGQPDISVRKTEDGEWVCELLGVDIYDPLTSEVVSSGATKVAAWFLDQDYDGRCFCITQAFFPNQSAWDKIAKALGDTADAEAFAAFDGTESLAFRGGKHERIAVKVIDPRGNEVMTIRSLGD